MRFVFIACLLCACAAPQALTRSPAEGPVTLDPIEPVAAYLEETGPTAGGGSAHPANLRVEVLEIAVLPTRPDGTAWDGGRLPDDAATTKLTEALAFPDAARRASGVLRGTFRGSAAPDLAGEITITTAGRRLAAAPLARVADSAVRSGAALPSVAFAPDSVLTVRVVDEDDGSAELVGEVTVDHDALLDALRANAPAVLDLRGSGTGAILFVTLRVTAP